ncbi:MAG: InlB B-repeat-containing protein [Clostridiales bacterium]|nr:InlB B-repeat-containing protein [Clostridiales bacterium]
MRNKAISIILTLIMVVGIMPAVSITASADDEIVSVTVSGTANYDYANEVVALVNEERAAEGLDPLVMDERLTEGAMQRAAELAIYYSHTRPDGTKFSAALGEHSGVTVTGENAAAGQTTPTIVVDSWMNSEGHRSNILRTDTTTIGVGCVKMGGYTYWIQIFGRGDSIQRCTYSGSKTQAFTISTYTSNLEYISVSYWSGSLADSLVIGTQATYRLSVRVSKAPGSAYVMPTAVPDVKDESTGEVIATTSVDLEGNMTITPTSTGSGYLYLYAYEGASPQSVEVVVLSGYTVAFDSDGGSSISSQTVAYNSTATEPTTPTRSGYTFTGWYTEAEDGTKYDFDTAVTKDLTLYAHWTANTTASSGTETTKTAETTTAVPETSLEPGEDETTVSNEKIMVSEETTALDSDSETLLELDEETTGTPDEETTGETTGETPVETTEAPDEETTDATETETDDETDTTSETEAKAEIGTSDDENTSEKSDTDNAALANDGDSNGGAVVDEENGSNAWIVALVVVLLIVAAGAVTFAVLKKKKNGDEITDIEEGTDTAEGDSESESSDAENHDDGDGNGDNNTEE